MGSVKIGIYPGAFDPVHDGHVAFAEAALIKHGLDRVFFLPEPSPRHKQGVKALQHRTAMVQRAVQSNPKLGLIVLEQQRFTVHETWPVVVARFKGAEIHMLLGHDVAQRLASWPNVTEFDRLLPKFIIALRGSDIEQTKLLMDSLRDTTKLDFAYSLIEPNYPMYGSSKIRQSFKNGHKPYGLHPDVLAYILQHGLYISGAT